MRRSATVHGTEPVRLPPMGYFLGNAWCRKGNTHLVTYYPPAYCILPARRLATSG